VNRSNLPHPLHAEALQARFARRVASRLEELSRELPGGVDERLRFARERALARAREARRPAAATPSPSRGSWWLRLASIVPLVLLIGGLTLIQQRHADAQIEAAADIDMALLSDDLPPGAYADPGFAAFLRTETQ
jgi:hypothetical protein